jgi:hypothetical protein
MQTFVGALIVALGFLLVIHGLNASESISSEISRVFTGSPTEKSLWLLAGGSVAVVLGMAIASVHRKQKTQ